MNKDFYFGYFCCFIFSQIHMDMMGKEQYIKRVNEFWMNTNIYMWIGFWFIGFAIWFTYEKKQTFKIEDIKNK